MGDHSPYKKSFLGSLLIHSVLLSFLILSFHQTVQIAQPHAGTIIQAIVVDSATPDPQEAAHLEQAQQVAQREQEKQVAQQKQEAQTKAAQLRKDMLAAKKEAAKEAVVERKASESTESLPAEKQHTAMAIEEERLAEQARLKEVRLRREKEAKKQAQHVKEQKALKAQAALKTKLAAEKARIAAEKSRMAADHARQAAHQAQIHSEMSNVVSAWSAKIEDNRRSMSAFQSLATNLSCRVLLRILPDGSVHAQVVQSSGNALYDDLALKAIYKAEPFALPENPELRDKLKAIELNFLNDQ